MSIESDIVGAFNIDFRRKFASALARGLVGATRQVETYARRLGHENFGNPEDASVEFKRIAELMHTELLKSYDDRVEGRKAVQSYQNRNGTRLPGVMRRVLENESMVYGDGHGIWYLNLQLLNDEAKHWRRLNFGAQPAAQTPVAPLPVRFDDRVLFYAGSRGQARPAFQLPVGRFVDPRTGRRVPYGPSDSSAYTGSPPTVDRFFPGGGGQQFLRPFTEGIEGRHFIEAGFEVLAEQFGPTMGALFRKWGDDGIGSFHPTPTNVIA